MKLFVWDFHGVLEKDNHLATLDISNQVLKLRGYEEYFSEQDAEVLYGLKWYQYFEFLLPSLGFDEHISLQSDCFNYAENNLHVLEKHIKPNDHAGRVLDAINSAGHDQILVSNTRPKDLRWFVNTVGLGDYFSDSKLFGVNGHEKHGVKKDALGYYLKNKQFENIIIVGDSQGDMELKSVGGGKTYYYSHPHLKHGAQIAADYKISDLREILQELAT